ncbi:ROK family transcriptional regulator [Paenibacillus sp. BC26]|uniref:ROK family transcriptional regulator n=1 Tax=Paenibacillus sp. BC26 TaxID=1881032 RepID=UPI0008E221F7|nr:ROK family transcriptional regulator [Paenibacillus sp. BC26]SFT14879.1 Sugar kinase of the NBD/HSP70 family, may contain an N-terminal HTH domain [Paenibacillus sp. BC26]
MKPSDKSSQILRLVDKGRGISRKALSEETGLSQASLTKITKTLIEQGYLVEGERVGSGLGRKEVLLYARADRHRFLGIDIGGHKIRVAIADNSLHIQARAEWEMQLFKDHSDKAALLISKIEAFLESSGISQSSIDAIGVGVTGVVDPALQRILTIPNAEGWDNVELPIAMQEAFPCPVYMDEGGRTMAIAEKFAGKGTDMEHLITVQIGFGIAAGVIVNDRLLRGSDNVGGLLGHITADNKGIRCTCGNYGCLENIITYPMIELAYRTRGGKADSLLEAYQTNDKIALDVCLEAGEACGIALSNMVNLFNPKAIFVGGPVMELLPSVFDEMRRTILRRANRFATQRLQMERSSFGNDEGIVGALTLAKSKWMSWF